MDKLRRSTPGAAESPVVQWLNYLLVALFASVARFRVAFGWTRAAKSLLGLPLRFPPGRSPALLHPQDSRRAREKGLTRYRAASCTGRSNGPRRRRATRESRTR